MSTTNPTTPSNKAPIGAHPPHISTSFGTIGPLQRQIRLLLLSDSRYSDDRGAGLAFAHEGLPRPKRDLECHHFVLECGGPVLVLAAKHDDSCFYLLINLADYEARQAMAKAYSSCGLELMLVDRDSQTTSTMFAVNDDCISSLRQVLAGYETSMRDNHLWLLHIGELTSRLPAEFAKIQPETAMVREHHLLVLLGDGKTHFAGVREAVRSGMGIFDRVISGNKEDSSI